MAHFTMQWGDGVSNNQKPHPIKIKIQPCHIVHFFQAAWRQLTAVQAQGTPRHKRKISFKENDNKINCE